MSDTDLAALRMAYLATGDDDSRLVYADALEESGDTINASLLHKGPCHEIGGLVRQMVDALARCRFAPATFDKRFARDIHEKVHAGQQWLSHKQWETLWYLMYRYRRQIELDQFAPWMNYEEMVQMCELHRQIRPLAEYDRLCPNPTGCRICRDPNCT